MCVRVCLCGWITPSPLFFAVFYTTLQVVSPCFLSSQSRLMHPVVRVRRDVEGGLRDIEYLWYGINRGMWPDNTVCEAIVVKCNVC